MKPVAVPEDASGKDSPCPECGKAIPVPSRYNPIVAPTPLPTLPPAPPLLPKLPEPTAASVEPEATPSAPTLPSGYTHSRGIALSPCVVAWIPAIALTAILLLTLAPWVGVYPNGVGVYTQGAWRSINGWPTRNIQLEDLLLKELPAPSVYDRTGSDWLIMLPYILTLLLAIAFAWVERLESVNKTTGIPKRLPGVWPFRQVIIAGLAGMALLFLTLESTRGFGLERAMHAAVSEKFDAKRKEAGTSAGEQTRIDFLEGQELAKYGLERTGWFCLVMCLHVLVLLALLGRLGLERRGSKPPPRLVIQY